MSKMQIHAVAGVTVLVFAVGIVVSGGDPSPNWLRFYSYAAGAAVLVLAIWNRWLWRLPVIQRIKAVSRDLNGTWKGTLTTQWVDPSSGKVPPAKPAFLIVRQTSSSVSVTMLTDEMTSRSTLADVVRSGDVISLDYVYLSRPDSRVEDRSRMHPGSAALEVSGDPAGRLRGRYWTDRNSRGELDFSHRASTHADDYESATRLFS